MYCVSYYAAAAFVSFFKTKVHLQILNCSYVEKSKGRKSSIYRGIAFLLSDTQFILHLLLEFCN
jgi:hypothetical protein